MWDRIIELPTSPRPTQPSMLSVESTTPLVESTTTLLVESTTTLDAASSDEMSMQQPVADRQNCAYAGYPPTWSASLSPQRVLLSQQPRPMGVARRPSFAFGSQPMGPLGVRRIPSVGKKDKASLQETFDMSI